VGRVIDTPNRGAGGSEGRLRSKQALVGLQPGPKLKVLAALTQGPLDYSQAAALTRVSLNNCSAILGNLYRSGVVQRKKVRRRYVYWT
jgi:Fic family protein